MKRVFFFVLFILNFIGILANGTSVEVSSTLTLLNSAKVECSTSFDNRRTQFELTSLKTDNVKVYVKEAEDGKVELRNVDGEKVLVDLKSKITYNKKALKGNLTLAGNSDLKGKMTLRVVYN